MFRRRRQGGSFGNPPGVKDEGWSDGRRLDGVALVARTHCVAPGVALVALCGGGGREAAEIAPLHDHTN